MMYGGCPPWGTFTPGEGLLRFDLTDVDQSVWVRLGQFTGTDPDGGKAYDEPDIGVVADPGAEPDAVVAGRGRPDGRLALAPRRRRRRHRSPGDRAVYDRFAALVTSSHQLAGQPTRVGR